jgi:hypothetical protein
MTCRCAERRRAIGRMLRAAPDGLELLDEIKFIATSSGEDIARGWRGMTRMTRRLRWPAGSKSGSTPAGSPR